MHSNLAVNVYKQEEDIDPSERLRRLINSSEVALGSTFLGLVSQIKNRIVLSDIVDAIESGNINDVIELISSQIATFSTPVIAASVAAAESTATVLSNFLNIEVNFDQTNDFAVNEIRENRLRLVNGLTRQQNEAIREALIEGTIRGENPVNQARNFVDSIGLTANQERSVNNFRRLIEEGNPQALQRTLRDRRFDGTVRRAIRGETLTEEQIDTMVTRYRERLLRFRANTIARTEALRSVHQGNNLMYAQAISEGRLQIDRLVRRWVTARDTRVRDSHNGMDGQTRGFGDEFISDAGNALRYPGDERAPGSETIQCRCAVTTTLLPIGQTFQPET